MVFGSLKQYARRGAFFMSKQHITDVVIIGGGVIGSAIAYYLSKAGVQVIVAEREQVAAEASSAAAGLLAPLGNFTGPGALTDLLLASWSLYPTLIPELEEASGVHVEYYRPGALHTASSAEEVASLRKQLAIWESLGQQVGLLTADGAHMLEPLLGQNVEAAIYTPQESSIKPALMTRAYAEAARRQGAQFYERTEIIDIQHSNSRATTVQTLSGEMIVCNHVVIATGAWSARFSSLLNFTLPVSPMRGQILALKQPASPLQHILFGEEIYLVPKLDSTIYVGATVEQAGFDKSVTAEGIAWLLSSAIRLVPALASASIASIWAGLRPWSPDSQPILGKAPGWENVWLATGHSAIGFESSAISGQSIAEAIMGQVPEIIRPFGVERFL
jgi:glycine oxidase